MATATSSASLLASLVACAAILACGNVPGDASAVSERQLREMVRADLGPGQSFTDTDPVLLPETSAVVPGLVYVWARRAPTCDHCPRPEAIVATRGTTARVVRTTKDWATIAEGWGPKTGEEALRACLEAVATGVARERPVIVGEHTGSEPKVPSFILADTVRQLADSNAIPWGLSLLTILSDSGAERFHRNRGRLTAPRVSTDTRGDWTVEFWALQSRGAYRYQCSLPKARGWLHARAELVVNDSVAWPARAGW